MEARLQRERCTYRVDQSISTVHSYFVAVLVLHAFIHVLGGGSTTRTHSNVIVMFTIPCIVVLRYYSEATYRMLVEL